MPNSLRRLFHKLRFFARREKFDADLAEEMAYHRELKQRDLQEADPRAHRERRPSRYQSRIRQRPPPP